jgi:hypothetical protein
MAIFVNQIQEAHFKKCQQNDQKTFILGLLSRKLSLKPQHPLKELNSRAQGRQQKEGVTPIH